MALVHSGSGLLNNKHPHRDLCSCNTVVPRPASQTGSTTAPRPDSLQLGQEKEEKRKRTLIIGFYIKAAGLERELERELFWRAEVNMSSLNDFPCSLPPSVRSKLFLRANHRVVQVLMHCFTTLHIFLITRNVITVSKETFLILSFFLELCKTKGHVFFVILWQAYFT